jgi:hypothetical protein
MEREGRILNLCVWFDEGMERILMEEKCKIRFFTIVAFNMTLNKRTFKSKWKKKEKNSLPSKSQFLCEIIILTLI